MFLAMGLAVLLALAVAGLVHHQLTKVSERKPTGGTQKIVVAAEALPLGTRLDAKNVRVVDWPETAPITGMFAQAEDCIGRAVVKATVENEPILESNLAPAGSGSGLPAGIPEGMRAISVAVNDVIEVAGFVQPGTVVDVLATGAIEGQGQASGSVTRMVLEGVRVLAAGQKTEPDKQGVAQTVPVITLLVTPEQANVLVMASAQGRIQLALRNAVDRRIVNPPAVEQTRLFQGGSPAVAVGTFHTGKAAAPPPLYSIEVIRGNKKEVVSFPNP
jgi:pilus assembly protein CpaB